MATKKIEIEIAANEIVEILLVRKELDAIPPSSKQEQPTKRFYPLSWLVEYTEIPKNSIYQLTSKNKIPHFKRGRKLFFEKVMIDQWLEEGRVKSDDEIQEKAENYLTQKGRRRRHES